MTDQAPAPDLDPAEEPTDPGMPRRGPPPRTLTEKVAHIIGAYRSGRYATDAVLRERGKRWTRVTFASLLSVALAALIRLLYQGNEIAAAERAADRIERTRRDEQVAHAIDKLATAVDRFSDRSDAERLESRSLHDEILRAYGSKLNRIVAPEGAGKERR